MQDDPLRPLRLLDPGYTLYLISTGAALL